LVGRLDSAAMPQVVLLLLDENIDREKFSKGKIDREIELAEAIKDRMLRAKT